MVEGKYALVVACDRYADPDLKQLMAPAKDAEAFASLLENPPVGGFKVLTLINQPGSLTKERIESKGRSFSNEAVKENATTLYDQGNKTSISSHTELGNTNVNSGQAPKVINSRLEVESTNRDYMIVFENVSAMVDGVKKLAIDIKPQSSFKPKGQWEFENVWWDSSSYRLVGNAVTKVQKVPVALEMIIRKAGLVAWWLDVRIRYPTLERFGFKREIQIYNAEKVGLVKFLEENFAD